MSTSPLIEEAVVNMIPPYGAEFAHAHDCEGSKFHSPTPLILHRVDLVPWDNTGEKVYAKLCGTCRENLWVYQQILQKNNGEIEWELQRCFGNKIRALAKRGWDLYEAQRGVA